MRTTTIGGGSQIAGWQRDNFCTPRFSRRGVRPDLEHRPTVSSNVFSGPGAIAVGESDNWFSVVARLPLPGDGSLLPEKRLMLAVLNDALLTLARHRGAADYRAQKRVSEVDVWVASDDVEWPFAFVNVCEEPGFVERSPRGPELSRLSCGRKKKMTNITTVGERLPHRDSASKESGLQGGGLYRYLVLGLLRNGAARHGYALMKEYQRRSGTQIGSGRFYGKLQRLAAEGLVTTATNPP